jgi:2-haloacid dehalogenase
MAETPTAAVFDVNETLVDIGGLRPRFEEIGAPGYLLETWFASALRDGLALTTAGGYADFRAVALAALRDVLGRAGLVDAAGESAEHVISGFAELDLHPDVPDGLRRLGDAGVRIATLTNGSVDLTETLLERGGVAHLIERRLSVDDVRRWKPAAEPYHFAAQQLGVGVDQIALIAVHPWDVDGAQRAGLVGGWLNRTGQPYPDIFRRPAVSAADLPSLADALIAG